MKISTKGRYALRFMIDLALHSSNGDHVAMKDVSKRQRLSFKYLWLVIHPLVSTGLIKSVRGAGGGYKLGKEPANISVYDILKAVEGDLYLVECISKNASCKFKANCVARKIWIGATDTLINYLKNISLQDIVKKWPQKLATIES